MSSGSTGRHWGAGYYITTNHIRYARHGHWVRHRVTGQEGRIGCELPADGTVAVVWEDETSAWYWPAELEEVPDREPHPWYCRQDILRRRPDGRDDDLWWEDGPQVKWRLE